MWTARLRRWGETFWAAPAAMGLAAVVLAELLLLLDRRLGGVDSGVWFLDDLSATGSRALLTTVGGSMLWVAATAFSITVSVLATTSSTYGPRLVRNFMADRGNQLVLATLTSSFVYCLVVLRSVRSEEDGAAQFVPVVAVHTAVVIAVVDVAVLVYFIHHIASSTQVTTLQHRVGGELRAAVAALYPAEDPDATTRDVPEQAPAGGSAGGVRLEVRARRTGYVQSLALPSLVRRARAVDAIVHVAAMPGRHVVAGDLLAVASCPGPGEADRDERVEAMAGCFGVGEARTPGEDVEYAVQQVLELAVRALSPGTNDPYTAAGALDTLSEGLATVVARPWPAPGHLDDDGRLRVVAPQPRPHELLGPVFSAIRSYGLGSSLVVARAAGLAERLLDATGDDRVRATLAAELDALATAYHGTGPFPPEAARVAAALAAAGRA